MAFERITTDSAVLGGVPCIRGMCVPVATVVGMVADGMTFDEILADFPYLEEALADPLPPSQWSSPASQAAVLLTQLPAVDGELADGAVVVIEETRTESRGQAPAEQPPRRCNRPIEAVEHLILGVTNLQRCVAVMVERHAGSKTGPASSSSIPAARRWVWRHRLGSARRLLPALGR